MLCAEHLCTGCGACRNACPKDAIIRCENEHGFLMPKIDGKRCVDCGLCEKVCPVIRPVQVNRQSQCFVSWCEDAQLRKTAASAGVVSALMQKTLRDGGVVFGTRYCDGRLIVDYIEDETQIPSFQGSKYVQADVGEAYRQVKTFLEQGRSVLFPGTPCQIAGLRRYLGKEDEKLLTVDLVCHGITSGKYLREYIRHRKKDLTYDRVLFRGECGEKLVAYHKNEAVWTEDKWQSPFYMAYAKGLIHRENCYHCPYASANRCADLTAGDFWGINRAGLPKEAAGILYPSLVLANTPKGAIALVEADICSKEQKFIAAVDGNKQLSAPCICHVEHDHFLKTYANKGFYQALRGTAFFGRLKIDIAKLRIWKALNQLKHKIFNKRG